MTADLRLKGEPEPPPPARQATETVKARAKRARQIMESGQWVSDGECYKSRNTAAGVAARLKKQLSTHENIERECVIQRVRLTKSGWRWWLALKDRIADPG